MTGINKTNNEADTQPVPVISTQNEVEEKQVHTGYQTLALKSDEIDLDYIDTQSNGSYKIKIDEKTIGVLIKRNGKVLVNLKGNIDIRLTGRAAINKLIVKSNAKVDFDADITGKVDVMIVSRDIHINKAMASLKSVILKASESVVINEKISAAKLKIKAKKEVNNYQQIKSGKLSIKSNKINQFGRLEAVDKLKIKSKDFRASKDSLIQSEHKTKFIGEQVDAQGQFIAKGLAFFSAKDIKICNHVQLPSHTYFHAASLQLDAHAHFNLHSDDCEAHDAEVRVDKQLRIAESAEMYVDHATLSASAIINAGKFSVTNGPLTTNRFANEGMAEANFSDADVNVKYLMTGKQSAKYTLVRSQLTSAQLAMESQTEFIGDESTMSTDISTLNSDTTLSGCNWNSNVFMQGGNGAYKHCEMTFKNQFQVMPDANLTATASQFKGLNVQCDGHFTLKALSTIECDDLEVQESFKLDHSSVKAKNMFALKKTSSVGAENNSAINLERKLRLNGNSNFKFSYVGAKCIDMEGGSDIEDAVIKASQYIYFGDVKAIRADISAHDIHYLGKSHFIHTTPVSQLSMHEGETTFTDSCVSAEFDLIARDAKLSLKKSHYKSQLTSSQGNVTLVDTKANIDVLSLSEGKFVCQRSDVEVEKATSSEASAITQFVDNNFTTSAAYIEGAVESDHSGVRADNIVLTNKKNEYTRGSIVHAKNNIVLQGDHSVNKSLLSANKFYVNGKLSLQNASTMIANESIACTGETSIDLKDSVLKANKSIDVFGAMSTERSQLLAEDISIYKKLKAKKAKLTAKNKVVLRASEGAELDEMEVAGHSISVGKNVLVESVKLKTTQHLHIEPFANVTVKDEKPAADESNNQNTLPKGLYLESENSIHIDTLANVSGSSLAIKAYELLNEGSVDMTKLLSSDADFTSNDFGHLCSQNHLNIKAAKMLVNSIGQLKGGHTNITTPAFFNFMGDICGTDSLSISSLANLNLGLYRSYNANVNSVLDINLGLILPTLPTKLSTAVSFSHILSISKILLSNFLPGKEKIIDLSFRAVPIAKQAILMLMSKDKKPFSLPTLETIQNQRIIDWMEPLLTVKNLLVSGYGLYQASSTTSTSNFSFGNIFQELSPNSFVSAFRMPSLSSFANVPLDVFGPTYSSSSIFSLQGGLVASQNLIHTSLIGVDTGVDVALQSDIQSTCYLYHSGMTAANQVTMSGIALYNAGLIADRQSMKLKFEKIDNEGLGAILANHADISAQEFTNNAEFIATVSHVNTETFINNQAGHVLLEKSKLDSGHIVNEGGVEVKSSIIKSQTDFVQTNTGSMETDIALIEAKKISLDGRYKTADTTFKAEQDIETKSSAQFEVEKSTALMGMNVKFAGTAQNKDSLSLNATEKLLTTETAKIDGVDGSLYLAGDDGAVKGHVLQKNIVGEFGHVDDVANFIPGTGTAADINSTSQFYCQVKEDLTISNRNQRDGSVTILANSIEVVVDQHVNGTCHMEATKGDLNAKANLSADGDLSLKANKDLNLDKHQYTAKDDVYLRAGGSVINKEGKVVADRNVFVVGENGIVRNQAGVFQGKNHLEVNGGNGVVNEAIENEKRGKHGKIKEYKTGKFIGGKGVGFDGDGVLVTTKGKFSNDASDVAAPGNIIISAEQGVISIARTNRFFEDEYTKRHGMFHQHKKHITVIGTQVQKSTMGSSAGKMIINGGHEGIKVEGTDIASAQGTTMVSEKKIEMLDLVTKKERISRQSSWWGLTHNNEQWHDESSVPTTLTSMENIKVVSTKDDIYMRSVEVSTPGQASFEGNNVTMTVSKLQHEYSRETSGIDMSVFGQSVVNSNAPQHAASMPFTNGETTINHVRELANSNGGVETAMNAVNTATSVANTANSVMEGVRNNDLLREGLKHFGVGDIQPSVNATYTHEREKSSYQTSGVGSINVGDLSIKTRDKATLEGLPVNVARDMEVEAKEFVQKGLDLESHHKTRTESVGVGLSTMTGAPTDVSANISNSRETHHEYVNQQTHVGGNFQLKAQTWTQDGANADVQSMSGHAETHNIITHTCDTTKSSSSYGAATSGEVNYAQSKTDAKLIKETAGVNIRGADKGAENNSFTVETLNSTGGVITGNGNARYLADQVVAKDVKEDNHTKVIAASGNINDILPEKETSKHINASDDEARQIKTVNASFIKNDYEAEQHAAVDMQNGKFLVNSVSGFLASEVASSKEVTKNESHAYKADVPLYDQISDNANWAASKLTGNSYTPARTNQALAFEKLNSKEEIESFAKKVKAMEQMCEAVYGGAALPAGFLAVDNGYVNPDLDSRVVAYVNKETGQLVFAFMGTNSMTNIANDDADIALGRTPRSFDGQVETYIEENIKHYSDYEVTFTGHSLGGAIASLASDKYKYPAYAFDNPGIKNDGNSYDFSQVTSYQSTGNIVNHAGPMTGREYDQGNVVQLSSTARVRMLLEVGKQLGPLGSIVVTTYEHKLVEIKSQLESYLENQITKQGHYRSENTNTFMQPSRSSSTASVMKENTNDVKQVKSGGS